MPVEVGIQSGLCRIIFVLPVMQKQVVALVVLILYAPSSQIKGRCVHAPKDTPFSIQMTHMAPANQTSYKAVKKKS